MIIRNNSDAAWKEILDVYFKDFIEYCLPELYGLINWDKSWDSLDKELQAITKGANAGKRLLDKLFKVFLKDGQEQWLLVHLEVQGKPEDDFPKRMFTYAYRIFDKYQKPIASCAILTDEVKNWRPAFYQVGLAGSYLRADYLVVKLIDYRIKTLELDLSSNPFASVILVQLAALDTKRKPDEERKQVKFELTKRLYKKGFTKENVLNLYKFIDWLIGLSTPLELEYLNEIYELEEATKMAYITNAEKLGPQVALERSMIKMAKLLIEEGVNLDIIQRTTGFSTDRLEKIMKEIKFSKKEKVIND